MTAILQCQGLAKQFGAVPAASGLDLTLQKGEICGVIGANGAGKTTLINMISGYLKPSAGSILLQGGEIAGLSPRAVRSRGVARSFQIPQLFDSSTVLENMMLALVLARPGRLARLAPFRSSHTETALHILARFGIEHHKDARAGDAPQGVRKLLDSALALCGEPRLILLDEPTSGVSRTEKDALMETLWSVFRKAGTTVLFIEHDMDLIARFSTRVAALSEGRVFASGEPDAVLRDPHVLERIVGRRRQARSGSDA